MHTNTNNNQTREHFTHSCVKLREGSGTTGRTIEGTAVVFNSVTTLYEDDEIVIREVIKPSCITSSFLRQQDIKLNILHNRDMSIARYNKGQGSLRLNLRSTDLSFSVEAPKCDIGDRALELINNGTYTGCSFEFLEGDFERRESRLPNGKIDILYTHKSFKAITALTVAMDPAYAATSVEAREQKFATMSIQKSKRVAALRIQANNILKSE